MEDPALSFDLPNDSIPRLTGLAGAPGTAISDVAASSQSPEERLVRKLYRMRDPSGPNGLSLDNALEIISVQLNSTPSHFLLELLQNADDAKYDKGVVPELKASATTDKNLVIHCNELGFTDDDVVGICDIGRSTKRQSATTTGEKGIGFKSVFRLADLVWIASNGFTFKLDKNEKLGLIRPLWDSNYPVERVQRGTTMFLRIPSQSAGGDFGTKSPWDEALHAIISFDVTYMLFLRQLRKIELAIYRSPQVYQRRDSDENKMVKSETITFRRSVITRDGDPYKSYIVLKKRVSGLSPRSSQRPMTASEIELAFPVKHDFAEAQSGYQDLYTFLPVKSTKFKFLIQADFVLAASREDVEQSSKWNCELRDAIPDVFVAALDHFNGSSLRYSWLLYLSSEYEMDPFFRSMMKHLLAKLKASPILETENGWEVMAPPEELVSVPDKYRYTLGEDSVTHERSRTDPKKSTRTIPNTSKKRTVNGSSGSGKQAPIIPSRRGKGAYLSLNYPAECKSYLGLLGVCEMDYDTFVDDFVLYVNNDHAAFAAQPDWWHERVSKVLMEGHIWDSSCRDKLKSLRIAPLVDATVSWDKIGVEGTLFFSDDDLTSSSLPRGAGLRRIDSVVQKGTRRFDLLERLGAKVASKEKESIHTLLEQWHQAKTPPTPTTNDDLVSHAVFLFRTKYERPIYSSSEPVDFWVATMAEVPRPGSETHLEAYPELDDQKPTSVLYDGYWKAVEEHEREPLRKWMGKQLGLWNCPRLVSTGAECELSGEMSSIRDEEPYRFLGILKKYWGAYKRRFDNNTAFNRLSLPKLSSYITGTEVVCQNGERVPLNKTILSDVDLRELIGITPLPILSLPVDDFTTWQFLQSFGVQIKLAVDDWVGCLEKLSGRLDTEVSHVAEAYKWLHKLGNGEIWASRKVKDAFSSKKLVFIPSDSNPKGEATWVSVKHCVWQGHKAIELRQYSCILGIYDKFKLRDLFVDIIGVKPRVGIGHLVDEAKHVKDLPDTTENLEYISRLCGELSFQLQHEYFIGQTLATGNDQAYQNYVKQLQGIELFPIQPARTRPLSNLIHTRAPGARESWYVADRDHFRQCFEGRLDILRLNAKQIEECDALLRKLNCRDQFLSKVAALNTDQMTGDGGLEPHKDLAAQLRKKARYIDSLSSKRTGVGAMSRMREIKVYSADAVRVTWKVGNISSHIDSRRAIAAISSDVLSIYLQKADLDRRPQRPPLELAEEMAFFFMIPRDRTHLVQFVLACEEFGDIEATLRKAGVSILPEDWKQTEDELSVVDPIDSKSRDQEPQEAKPDDGQKEGTFEERANENTSLGLADTTLRSEYKSLEKESLPDETDDLKKADQQEKDEPQKGISKDPSSNPPSPPPGMTESPTLDEIPISSATDTVGKSDEVVFPPNKSSPADAQAIPLTVAPPKEKFEEPDGDLREHKYIDQTRLGSSETISSGDFPKPTFNTQPAFNTQKVPSMVAPSEEEFDGRNGDLRENESVHEIHLGTSATISSGLPQKPTSNIQGVPPVVALSHTGPGGVDGDPRQKESLDRNLHGRMSSPETPAAMPSGFPQSDFISRETKNQGVDQGLSGKKAKAGLETAPPNPDLTDPLSKPKKRLTIPLQKQRDAALAKFLLDLSPPTDFEEKAQIDETTSQTPSTSVIGGDYKSGDEESGRKRTDRSPSDTERQELEQALDEYLNQNLTAEPGDTSRHKAFPGTSQDPRLQHDDSIEEKQRSPVVFPSLEAMETIKEEITGTSEPAKLKTAMAQNEREQYFKRRHEVENQFGQIVQGSQLLRSTGPTNVYYVSNRERLPPLDPSMWPQNTLAVLESRMQVLDDASKNRAVYALLPSPSSRDDVEDDFLGQVWIAQWLRNHLGHAYNPNRHWKSGYRTKLGYSRPDPLPDDGATPFQVMDGAGVLGRFLAGMGYRVAGQWARHGHAITYHIDVKTTRSEAPIPTFSISYSRFDKARKYRLEAGDQQPYNVFIFVIVSNIHSITEPRAAFYVDPWAAFADGRAKVSVSQNVLSLSFHQPVDAEVPDPAYRPPPEVKRPWFSRLATKINRVLSSKREPPESGVDEDYYPVSERTGLMEYRWKPLGQPDKMIRLLKLYGGSGELYGSLISFSLDARDRPAYTALSYTWGSGLKMFSLRILRNGGRRSGGPHQTIPITASLYLALRRMRPRSEHQPPLYIWADAVCIAQTPTRDDWESSRSWKRRLDRQIREKTQQIRLLAGIFTSAEMVWAWLGDQEPGDGSQVAMSLLDKLGRQLEDFRKAGGSLPTRDAAALFRNFALPPKEDPKWAAVSNLISRRWFSRVWIVQEVVLATRISIRCGNSTTSWDRFFWAVRLCLLVAEFNSFGIADGQARKNVLELGERRNRCWVDGKLETKGDMFELLGAFHQKGATVPRDRLFALLSMAADETKEGLEPDYRLSLLDLVKRWGAAFVNLGRGIDLLYLARLSWRNEYDDSEHRNYKLPSWLPDLTASQFPETISKWKDLFSAGIAPEGRENAIVDAPSTVERDELCIQGIVVDTIKELGPRDLGSNSSDPRRYLREIFKMIDKKAKEAKLSEDEIRDIRCKLPIGGAELPTRRYWDSKNPKVTAFDAYKYLDRYLQLRESGDPWENEEYRLRAAADGDAMQPRLEEIADPLMAYIDTASKFADKFYPAHAVVCWTKGNRAALVPHVAQKGDIVVIFPGAKVPLILRQETEVAHVLVGEGYVHGIMGGEAMTMQGEGRMESRRIRIM